MYRTPLRGARGAPLAVLLAIGLICPCPSRVAAEWVWTPETGLFNPDSKVVSTAEELLALADKAFEKLRFADAARVYQILIKAYPESPEAKASQLKLLDAQVLAQNYKKALATANRILAGDADTETINRVVERKHDIGRAYLTGAAPVYFLGIKLSGESYGVTILEDLVRKYPYQASTDTVLYSIGEYYFGEREFEEAEQVYRSLITDFPESAWVELAEYQIGESAFRRLKGVEYDLAPLKQAENSFERYVARFPGGEKVEAARERLQEIDRLRADRLFRVASFYVKDQHPKAAIYSLERILKDHPQAPVRESAEQLLREIKDRRARAARAGQAEEPSEDEKRNDARGEGSGANGD